MHKIGDIFKDRISTYWYISAKEGDECVISQRKDGNGFLIPLADLDHELMSCDKNIGEYRLCFYSDDGCITDIKPHTRETIKEDLKEMQKIMNEPIKPEKKFEDFYENFGEWEDREEDGYEEDDEFY
jgi:hypothetical protein